MLITHSAVMPRFKPIRFTHLKNRLKDKDLDDPRSQKARELRSSMIAEKTRVFPFHKRAVKRCVHLIGLKRGMTAEKHDSAFPRRDYARVLRLHGALETSE